MPQNLHDVVSFFTDPSIMGMFFSALFTVLYGSIRAGWFEKEVKKNPELKDAIQSLDWKAAILFPIVASASLILLFYFMGSLYFVLLFVICAYAVYGIYFAFKPLEAAISSRWFQNMKLTINVLIGSVSGTEFGLLVFAVACVATWFFTGYWLLNNLIGFGLCVSYLSFLRLPNIKIATLLLCGLFFYDIFWVFYSKPVFGKNVMVEVAKGLDLPVKYVMPVVHDDGKISFSMLGLGDMVIPGLLLAFVHRLDVKRKRKLEWGGYFLITFTGYAVGLLITYISLVLFNVAQPALLYLVPCMLIPLMIVAYKRSQIKLLWNGLEEKKQELPQ